MKTYQKIIARTGAAITGFAAPLVVLAATNPFGQGGQALVNLQQVQSGTGLNQSQTLPGLIGTIINVILGFLGIILLGYLLYAGFLWMTAGGESKKVDEAKTMIRNAIIGLILIVASVAISNFVVGQLANIANSA